VRNSCMSQVMKAYMECLKANKYESEKCRKFSKDYLECRMERYQSIILESCLAMVVLLQTQVWKFSKS
jgi:hypothetical protein